MTKVGTVTISVFKNENNVSTSFDIETSQRQAHDGIKALMKMDDDFYTKGDKVLFDYRRTIITGCSFYFGRDNNHIRGFAEYFD